MGKRRMRKGRGMGRRMGRRRWTGKIICYNIGGTWSMVNITGKL